ncbi:J domain-containing protein [bacterium]|nr:J domain-containing protein [bacterium]
MNYYDILGVPQQASQQEIKTAYRKLAMEHHPDRGGNESHFQKISQAYETLSDANKKHQYDQQLNQSHVHHHFESNFRSFEDVHNMFHDIFGQANRGFHFEFGRGRSFHGTTRARNFDLNIQCRISLLDSYIGKDLEAKFGLPSGRQETVVINIPPGIKHGETISFAGMGDDTYPQVPRGNLNVTIEVFDDPNFKRREDDIVTIIEIDVIEAMIGCTKQIETLDGKQMPLHIIPGIHHGSECAIHNMGFRNIRSGRNGNFVVIIQLKVPTVKNKNIIKKLQDIKNEIDNLPK